MMWFRRLSRALFHVDHHYERACASSRELARTAEALTDRLAPERPALRRLGVDFGLPLDPAAFVRKISETPIEDALLSGHGLEGMRK